MAFAQDEEDVEFQAPDLKVPLPSFPLEKGGASQPWPEHLNRQDPFARFRKGASRYYPPTKFDPFKEWREPAPELRVEGHLMEAPAPFAPLAAEAPALPRPSERCQRCGSLFPSDANFCARCGLARSTEGQSYQHPEKLLPGPPLRHEHRTSPGFSTSQLPPEPNLGGSRGSTADHGEADDVVVGRRSSPAFHPDAWWIHIAGAARATVRSSKGKHQEQL